MGTPEARWILSIMPHKDWMVQQWKDAIKVDAHGSSESNNERDRVGREVCLRWRRGGKFVEVPWGREELPPGPGLRATAAAIIKARAVGRSVTMEDNLAAMGLGMREAALLGGYEVLMHEATPEMLSRVRPIVAAPEERVRVAADANVRACLLVHAAEHPEFGMVMAERSTTRRIVVVAAKHGSGMSRLARRFRQTQAVRFDRLASVLVGQEAYYRNIGVENVDGPHHRECERVVAAYLASGGRPDVKVLLTHERPMELVRALRAQGLVAHWYHYCPDEAERARAVASRRVPAGMLRYMQATWRALSRASGYVDRIEVEEQVVQLISCC